VAVEPPPALVDQLLSLERPSRAGLRWTRPEQWHVTLRFLAAVDPDALLSALSGVTWPEGVWAEAGPAPAALSRQIWVLPVRGIERLADAVLAATRALDEPEHRVFRGHLTLARARHPRALADLPAPAVSARWPVREFVAVRSELLPRGAVHHVIGRFWVGPG